MTDETGTTLTDTTGLAAAAAAEAAMDGWFAEQGFEKHVDEDGVESWQIPANHPLNEILESAFRSFSAGEGARLNRPRRPKREQAAGDSGKPDLGVLMPELDLPLGADTEELADHLSNLYRCLCSALQAKRAEGSFELMDVTLEKAVQAADAGETEKVDNYLKIITATRDSLHL